MGYHGPCTTPAALVSWVVHCWLPEHLPGSCVCRDCRVGPARARRLVSCQAGVLAFISWHGGVFEVVGACGTRDLHARPGQAKARVQLRSPPVEQGASSPRPPGPQDLLPAAACQGPQRPHAGTSHAPFDLYCAFSIDHYSCMYGCCPAALGFGPGLRRWSSCSARRRGT